MANSTQARKQEVLRFTDLLPGLLSISWRLPSIISTMRGLLSFSNDSLMSMGTVLERNAVQYAHNTAILYENVRYTHRELNESVNRYAHYLMSQGFQKGDVAVVLVDNRPELLMIIGAISKIGGTSSLINPNHRGHVLVHSINLTRGKFFIVGEELLEAFEEVKPGLQLTGEDKLCFQPEHDRCPAPSGYVNFSQVLQGQSAANPPTTGQVRLGDPFAYVFTSGTTGLPKASIQTHRRWFSCQYWFGKIVLNMKTSDVHYCALPFCHSNALNVSWGATSAKGTALAIRRKFSASHFLEDVRKFKANSFIYIGELCRYLLNQPPKPDDADNPLVSCLGNGLRPEIWKEFKKRFGISRVHELYGAAEGTLIFTNLLNVDCTVGMCLTPFAIVKYDLDADEPVRDEKGFMVRVSPGEKGLILGEVSDSLPFAGYSDKDATQRKLLRNVFKQGDCWFNFGDLVLNQGYKHIQFVDRLGDTYRWKGENVSTTEVESVVNTLPQVSECTAYGVKVPGADGRAGMLAIIPLTSPEDFDLQALTDLVRNTLPSYAVPKFLRLKTEFETTGTHKIKKTSLRDEGFDPNKMSDPLYVLLPDGTKYQPLTRRVYEEIEGGVHRF
ncbi:MAG: long-chain-acyl-CoA synthetase [Candidatus Tectomicrobia bacterium]|uniref:Long-chain-acyl-CoA synthetase n=1 Tax=Tectimicrobiota bacterium TaxID=2528274 RepID=A0A933GPL7_UNCTE|nr:long-chain-acyl-CoA synthetase [Candidatus Tectomicrobia bacterium]